MLGSLDHVTRQLIVHTSPTKRSSDFIAHLEQLDRLFGPQPGRQAKPVVLVEDNGPIHTSKRSLAALAARAHWLTVEWLPNTPPNSMKSSRSGAILRPITSPTRPSQTSPPSTKPSMTPSSILTASASPIRWPCQENLCLAGGRRRHEIGERQNDTALRNLHPRLDRAWPGAGVQLARQSKGGLGSLHEKSQSHEGWKLIRTHYDDGGYSGGSMDRPALKRLLDDVRARQIDVIIVYKVDRLTRSLADFAKLVELFDAHQVSFVSVTQAFNTTTSMGRLTLNVLLSFAQFEREVTGERIRDKIAASKRKGIWMGGVVPLGYRVDNRALHVVEEHAAFIRDLYRRYLEIGSVVRLKAILDQENIRLPLRADGTGKTTGGGLISRGHLYKILSNPIYLGRLTHRAEPTMVFTIPSLIRRHGTGPAFARACSAHGRQLPELRRAPRRQAVR